MRVSHLSLFLLAALVLGACASDGITTVTEMSTAYDSDDYAHEASVKDIFVVVRGEAFGLSQQQLAQIVTQDMQGGGWGPNPHFTTVPGDNVGKMFSYVMVLNPSDDLTADAACNNPSKISGVTQASASGVTRLLATMCRYDASMIGTDARAVNVTSPQDPRFRELIRTAMMELTTPLTRDSLLFDHGGDDGGSTTP